MKVLITGGTGCISGEIAALAAKRNDIELYLLNRGTRNELAPPQAILIQGDLSNPGEIKALTRGMRFDVVADFLSYSVEDLDRTLDVFSGVFNQFIFVSSAAVYRISSPDETITEDKTPADNTAWAYSRNKILCEARLREERDKNGLNYTIVRPSFTYNNLRLFYPVGPSHQKYSWTIAERILRGKPLLMHGDGKALCTLTYAADFAKGFAGLMGNPGAFGEAFHITSDENMSYNRCAEMLGEALGVETKLCHIPADVLGRELGGDFGEKLAYFSKNAVFDSGKTRKLVPDFVCSTNFKQGIRKCVRFYEDNPNFKISNPEWHAIMDRLAEKYGDTNV